MLDTARKPGEPDPDHVEPTDHQIRIPARGEWWLVGASRRGDSHIASGADREDAFGLHVGEPPGNRPWFCVAVADGVGSAPMARVGSKIAVETLLEHVTQQCGAHAPASENLRKILSLAAWEALRALNAESERRGRALKEFGTTLLAVLGVERAGSGWAVGVFQAGNGLVASAGSDGVLVPLIDPRDETEDGSIFDFTSPHIQQSWDDRRFRHIEFDGAGELPRVIALMTDGVADDLIPLPKKSPILSTELRKLACRNESSPALLELISYSKRGSTDDRTLACVFPRAPACDVDLAVPHQVEDGAADAAAVFSEAQRRADAEDQVGVMTTGDGGLQEGSGR